MVQWGMRKSEAIELLGGSVPAAAEAIGVTYQAVDKWPDPLPTRIADRVQAALWRRAQEAIQAVVAPTKERSRRHGRRAGKGD